LFEVTQPRVTCYRVCIRMTEPQMAALLVAHGKPGFYCRVLEEGEVEAGDEIVQVAAASEPMTISEINALLYMPGHPRSQLERALRIPALRLARLLPGAARAGGERQCKRGARSSVRPAPGLVGVPASAGVAQGSREQQRDLAGS
jgi:MOSC domain/YiiM-like, 3-alpha helix domain